MRQIKESDIQKDILDYLKIKHYVVFKHRNVGIYKKETGTYIPLAFGEKGISDLLACAPDGRFWAIEVKKPGGRPSPDQLAFIESVKRNNGVAFIAESLDEVIPVVETHFPSRSVANKKSPVQIAAAQPSQSQAGSKASRQV